MIKGLKPIAYILFVTITGLTTVSACSATAVKNDVAAVIINATTESRAELLHVVSSALNIANVILADDALTNSNVLIIDRKQHRDLQNNPIMGRNLEKPIQFYLLKNGEQCILTQRSNNQRWVLKQTHCSAI